MVLVLNESDKNLTVRIWGKEYVLPVGEPVDIPEKAATGYFGYGLGITEEVMNACIENLRATNPFLVRIPDQEVWDNYVCKVSFNAKVVKKIKKGMKDDGK